MTITKDVHMGLRVIVKEDDHAQAKITKHNDHIRVNNLSRWVCQARVAWVQSGEVFVILSISYGLPALKQYRELPNASQSHFKVLWKSSRVSDIIRNIRESMDG